MPLLVLVALLVVVLFVVGIWITAFFFGLALHLLMAGLIGWAADQVVPGRIPYGFLGAILAGLLGGLIGFLLFGQIGPRILGFDVIAALLGTILLVAIIAVVGGLNARRQRV